MCLCHLHDHPVTRSPGHSVAQLFHCVISGCFFFLTCNIINSLWEDILRSCKFLFLIKFFTQKCFALFLQLFLKSEIITSFLESFKKQTKQLKIWVSSLPDHKISMKGRNIKQINKNLCLRHKIIKDKYFLVSVYLQPLDINNKWLFLRSRKLTAPLASHLNDFP